MSDQGDQNQGEDSNLVRDAQTNIVGADESDGISKKPRRVAPLDSTPKLPQLSGSINTVGNNNTGATGEKMEGKEGAEGKDLNRKLLTTGNDLETGDPDFYFDKKPGTWKRTASEKVDDEHKLSTLMGVFIPCLQNILGVILFIRLSILTGYAGIGECLLLVGLCCITTFLTAISMSAIATNGKIEKGGSYFMISRSLGPPSGGAVGTLFFLGTACAASMYIIGAIEAFGTYTGVYVTNKQGDIRLLGFILSSVLCFLNYVGLKYVSKAAVVFLGAVLVSVLAMYVGIWSAGGRSVPDGFKGITGDTISENWGPDYGGDYDSLQTLLAIFFPSVTGIMAGSNRSGDLKDPSVAIPKGTLGAQLTTSTIYLTFVFFFGAVSTRENLQDNESFVAEIAWPTKYLVMVGVLLSTIGAGLQSLAGAPRLLLAIAEDDLLPVLNTFKGSLNKSLLATYVISTAVVMIGSLNAVAPIITMFFLMCYGFVNFCCFLLGIVDSPNWRPTWKYYHPFVSFIGCCFCFGLMFAISWWSAIIAIVFASGLFAYINFKKQEEDWGDGLTGLKAERAKSTLLQLDPTKRHVKNWKPQILVCGYVEKNGHPKNPGLLKFLKSVKNGKGFSIYGCTLVGPYDGKTFMKAKETQDNLHRYIKDKRYNTFSKVVVAPTTQEGLLNLIQNAGLGGLQPNTCLFAWPTEWEKENYRADRFVSVVNSATNYGHCVLVLKNADDFEYHGEKFNGNMDIWWICYEGGLLLLMAYLLHRSKFFRGCKVRIFIVSVSANPAEIEADIKFFLKEFRIFIDSPVEVIGYEYEDIEQFSHNLPDLYKRAKQYMDEVENLESRKESLARRISGVLNLSRQGSIVSEAANIMYKIGVDDPASSVQGGSVRKRTVDNPFDENDSPLNALLKSRSANSDMILTNLPYVMEGQEKRDYMKFVERTFHGLKRVVLIRGTAEQQLVYNKFQ